MSKVTKILTTALILLTSNTIAIAANNQNKATINPAINILLTNNNDVTNDFTNDLINGKNYYKVEYFCNGTEACQWESYGVKFLDGTWFAGQFSDEVSEYEALSTYNLTNAILFVKKVKVNDYDSYNKLMSTTDDYLHVCSVFTEAEISYCTNANANSYWFSDKTKAQEFYSSR